MRNKYFQKIIIVIVLLSIAFFLTRIYPKLKKEKVVFNYKNTKLWAHRVNSIQKLNIVLNNFDGFELDVVYDLDKNIFDVNHPPAKSINLILDNYLSSIDSINNYKLWIDFKNLNSKTKLNALNRLNFIAATHKINPINIIVESDNLTDLYEFKNAGYQISFYLPSLHNLKSENLEQTITNINDQLKKNNNIYISSNCIDYQIMKEKFPKQKKLLWVSGKISKTSGIKTLTIINSIIKDKLVEVLLIPYYVNNFER